MENTINFTPEQLRDFARRCATLGRDLAIEEMRNLRAWHQIAERPMTGIITEGVEKMLIVLLTDGFCERFNVVLEDPLVALWQRELADKMPLIEVLPELRRQLTR